MEEKKPHIELNQLTFDNSISLSDYYREKETKQKQFTKQIAHLFSGAIQNKTK